MKQGEAPGIIVNTGSKQGITAPPGNLCYNVSNAAVKSFTEGLHYELREEKPNLNCFLLVPGWTNTSIQLKSDQENGLTRRCSQRSTLPRVLGCHSRWWISCCR